MKTLQDYHTDFIAYEKLAGRSVTYLRDLYYCIRRTLFWLGSTHSITQPEKLTGQHLEAWGRHVTTKTTGKGLPLRPTSVAKQLDSDRTFIVWLAKEGVVPTKLSESLPKIKLPEVLPTSVLTHRQMMRLLQSVHTTTSDGHQLRAMLEFLYSSGVRITELLDIDLDHLDLANRQALVHGKGGKERIVPFGDTAARCTETYLKAFRPLLLRDPKERALWLNRLGVRMPYYTFRLQLLAVAGELGLPVQVTAHTFRRSCTTELIRNGANLWHVKEVLGHANVENLRPYIKLTITDLKKTHARCHPRERDVR